jgi:hypothetical protein
MDEIKIQIDDEVIILSDKDAIEFEKDRVKREQDCFDISKLEDMKQAKLNTYIKLGLTEEEAKLLLGEL